jgi:polysaccharide deacetylase 2 family uncharacterized protein YibQ
LKFYRAAALLRRLPNAKVALAGRFHEPRVPPQHRHAVCLQIFLLFAFFLASCARKPLGSSQIEAITRDLVAAAQSAAGRNAQISIRPEMLRSANGRSQLIADDISIDLSNPSDRDSLEHALDRAAARHHLKRSPQSAAPGVLRFDYLLNGQRTHSIRIAFAAPNSFASSGRASAPRLAIIIDDMGSDQAAAAALLKLPFPLTFSVLPDQLHSAEIANDVYRRGDQVMLHLPMQFEGSAAKAEPVELRLGMPANEVDHLLGQMLSHVPHAIGVNNHEGSLATANPQLMSELMDALRRRNLFFIDSRTTAATVAFDSAERTGVRAASRKVFLDDIETRSAILRQLDLAASDAVRDGSAIAIGHPHPATIAALAEGLPRLKSRLRLTFASSLVH